MDKDNSSSSTATTIVVVLLAILGVGLLALLTCGIGGAFLFVSSVPVSMPVPPSSVTYDSTGRPVYRFDMPVPPSSVTYADRAESTGSAYSLEAAAPLEEPGGPLDAGESEKRDQATKMLLELRTYLDLYRVDVGRYPSTTQGLLALLDRPEDLPDAAAWRGPYTERIPADPWGQAYRFERDAADALRVWSLGPDGIDGTADDIETRVSLSP